MQYIQNKIEMEKFQYKCILSRIKMESKLNIVKTATFSEEPVFITEDGNTQTYIKKEITGPHKALSACLHLVFQHTADIYTIMIEIIAEKYGHSSEEMMEAIMKDERFNNVMVNPVLNGLNYFKKENLERVLPPTPPSQKEENPIPEMASMELEEKPRTLKLRKVLKPKK